MNRDDLKAFIADAGWPMGEAAKRIGVNREHLSKVLAGKRPMTDSMGHKVRAAAAAAIARLTPWREQ